MRYETFVIEILRERYLAIGHIPASTPTQQAVFALAVPSEQRCWCSIGSAERIKLLRRPC